MDKLGQISIDNALNVVVSCQVDQKLMAKNFTTIINALKELQQGQLRNESQLKDLSQLKDKFGGLCEKIQKLQTANSSSTKEIIPPPSKQNPTISGSNNNSGILDAVTKRLDKNEANILDSIKDINLINKNITDVRKQIADLKNATGEKDTKSDSSEKGSYGIQEIAQNMSKQLNLQSEHMKELQGRLSVAQNHIIKLQEELSKILKNREGKNTVEPQQSNSKEDRYQQLKQQFKDKFDMINQKIKNIQSETDHHDQQISYIKDMLAQRQNNNNQISSDPLGKAEDQISSNSVIKSDLAQLRKRIEEINSRQNKDVKKINDEIANLKLLMKGFKGGKSEKTQKAQNTQRQGNQSKTSIEEQRDNNNKGPMGQKSIYDKINEKLNDLVLKVNYLQKIISNGSKNSIGSDQKTPGGFPAISRHKKRVDPNATGFQQKEKSGIGRKDLSQLKAELEAWVKSLLDQGHQQQNMQDFYLKIQEIKHTLQKKADAEGTKKGLAFLQNKITQLYLFLTEPETEDAMIVRKGFNCLSCSKRVEKLRGRLGPRLNWNNMTTTNYSPPRVGYSKPMGEPTSIQKQDDL